jgi:hypothetical protein
MTDARLPERLLNDRRLQRLSADHYRTYVNALLWSVANRTDGQIDREDIALVPHWATNAGQALMDAKLFLPRSTGWLIADYAVTQTSRDELETLENIRARDREKKARKRAEAAAAAASAAVPEPVPGDCPGDVSPGQHREEGRQEGRPVLETNSVSAPNGFEHGPETWSYE